MAKPLVVGIAGGTCSGKSTLAQRLEAALQGRKLRVFHMDAYFKKETPNVIAPFTGKTYKEHNHPESFRLEELYADFRAACADESLEIVLFEGLLTLTLEPLRELLDLKVFVDLQSDERIVRRVKRWMATGQTFEEITDRYLDTVRYRHAEFVEPSRWYADVVLNGTLDANKGVDVLLTYIQAKLS